MTEKIRKLLNGQGENYILPFFWQHGEEESVLRHYMQVIKDSHIGAVCVESRPHPDFCGPSWWRDMDIILDEARKLGMKVWILDDSHFPTGFANGAMLEKPDELCRQSLTCTALSVREGETLHLTENQLQHPAVREKNLAEQYMAGMPDRTFDDDRLFSVTAFRAEDGALLDLQDRITGGSLAWTAGSGDWTVYLLHLSRNYGYHPSYINMMDRTSCRVLIDAVYEPHYAHYRDDFGKTIAGFFSDEPELGNGHLYDTDDPFGTPGMDYPWSRELEQMLRTRLDEKPEVLMPLMWNNAADPEKTARLRYTYMDCVSRLVKRDFSEQIGGWCHAHGVEYIGHLIEDDNHHTRTGSSLGHYFRGLFGQDMAGIDDIGGQVFPQGEDISYNHNIFMHRNGQFYHYLLGKLADSAASIQPLKKGRAMCEIFGNYGWQAGVRLEKYLIDHFLVRGINHFVPHAFSPKTYPDPDCPPHFYAGGNNPQYRHFGSLMQYTNRVCELMNGGRHAAPAAVLYHAEGDWTGDHMTSDQVCRPLADGQIDYDILPADVFSDRDEFRTRIDAKGLHVNTQTYKVLLIPYAAYIPEELALAVGELQKENVPVFYIEKAPKGLCSGKGQIPEAPVLPLEEVTGALQSLGALDLSIAPSDSRIRYRRYIHNDGSQIFLFVNEGTAPWSGRIDLKKVLPGKDDERDPLSGRQVSLYLYDAWDNTLSPVSAEKGAVSLCIEPLHSRILVADRDGSADLSGLASRETPEAFGREVPFNGDWKRSVCRSIEYPAFGEEKAILLPDNLALECPRFSGFVRYRNAFCLEGKEPLLLTVTDAHEGLEVFLNGISQGIQIVPPFRYTLDAGLKDGANELTIEAATTLERENSTTPDVTGQIREPVSHSGITGNVLLRRLV